MSFYQLPSVLTDGANIQIKCVNQYVKEHLSLSPQRAVTYSARRAGDGIGGTRLIFVGNNNVSTKQESQ